MPLSNKNQVHLPSAAGVHAKLTIDVLHMLHMRCPACLSTETIVNFAENGVLFNHFCDLFKVNIDKHFGKLLNWANTASWIGRSVSDSSKPSVPPTKEGSIMAEHPL